MTEIISPAFFAVERQTDRTLKRIIGLEYRRGFVKIEIDSFNDHFE